MDNWHWWGGRAQYAGFRGKSQDDFWTDPQLIADFKETIRFVLTRTNTLTGVRYADDKAILCWETGNELQSSRRLDARDRRLHQVAGPQSSRHGRLPHDRVARGIAGHAGGGHRHHAPLSRNGKKRSRSSSARMPRRAKGRKPYVVGEFGFVNTQQMADAIQATRETQTAGALAWSLRFRNRDGGFYWHSEPAAATSTRLFIGRVRPSRTTTMRLPSWR